MNSERFEEILNRRLALTKAVLTSKSKEYATDDDRLHNFKEAANLRGSPVTDVLLGMLVKHWVSIQDLVRGRIGFNSGLIEEKIGNAINYLILLEAALKEQIRGTR